MQIPRDHQRLLREWFVTPNEKTALFISALEKVAPALDPGTLAQAIATTTGIVRRDVEDLLQVVLSLVGTVALFELPSHEDAMERIFEVLAKDAGTDETFDDAARARFYALVAPVLGSRTLEVTSKAFRIISDNPHTFAASKTLSEMRPIFIEDGLVPAAWVILHQLKVRYFSGGRKELGEFFVALDRDDLDVLKQAVERAIEKHDKLLQVAAVGSLHVLR